MTEFPPFCLDPPNQCLWEVVVGESKRRVVLRPKAFAVLSHLVQHAGAVVTEADLLEAVWPGVYVQPEAIKGRLFEIRAALKDDPKAPRYIETLPRRGYRFIATVRSSVGAGAPRLAPPSTPLIGRDQPVARLRQSLTVADTGVPQIVFIAGEPGIGKSTLLEAFEREAVVHPLKPRVSRAHCIEGFGGREAYFPVLVALGKLCDGPDGQMVIDILAAHAPTWLVQFPALLTRERREMLRQEILGATRERMLREIGAILDALTVDRPLLLLFEDLQWVDPSTSDLISALARRASPLRLMLAGSLRPLEIAQSGHPLHAIRQNLLIRQTSYQIDLAPLTESETAQYLTALQPKRQPPPELVSLLFRHTGGNPLFLVAAIDNLTQRGLVSTDNDAWTLNQHVDRIAIEVPETLRQMIETQINGLSVEQRTVLEAASVAGAAFTVRVAAAATEFSQDTFDEQCHSVLTGYKLLRFTGFVTFPDGERSERYEFVHALYRDVLYGRLTPRRKMLMHRRIAACLEAAYRHHVRDIASEITPHFEECADWPKVLTYLELSADMAEQRYAPREAASFLERALELVDLLPPSEQRSQRVGLLERLAENYNLTYDRRLLATYRHLADSAQKTGRLDLQVRALRESVEHLSGQDIQYALETLDLLKDSLPSEADPLMRAELEMQCAVWPILAGHWSFEKAEACDRALAEIRRLASPAVCAPHIINHSYIPLTSSRYAEAEAMANEGLSILSPGGGNPCSTYPHTFAAYVIYNAAVLDGQWGNASLVAEETFGTFTKNGHEDAAQVMRLRTVWLHLWAMDFKGAQAICASVAATLGSRIKPSHERLLLTLSGAAEVGLGNYEKAEQYLGAAATQSQGLTAHTAWREGLMRDSATFELALGRGDVSTASAYARRFLERARVTPERTWQALAWEAMMRAALARHDAVEVRACLTQALYVMDGFSLPLAAWRVHASAFEINADEKSHEDEKKTHQAESKRYVSSIAASLPTGHVLREAFLQSPRVHRVLQTDPLAVAFRP